MRIVKLPFIPSRLRALRMAALAALLVSGSALLWQPPVQAQGQSLPSLGESDGLGVGQERRIGDQIIQHLYRDPDYLDDPILQEYVDNIWAALMAAAQQKGALGDSLREQFAWKVLLSKDRSVNAFALPGGYFGLHLGLINVVGSRDELASVMAHELSHVSQRHISRMVLQNTRQTPILIASMILGALAASKSPEAAQALMVGGHALAAQNSLNFSRSMEQEADRVGLGLMEPAGFEQRGFVLMFDKLYQANRINDTGAYPYLRTHPLTAQRISDMQARMPDVREHAQALPLTLEHALIVARSRILSRSEVDVLRQAMQVASQRAALVQSSDTSPVDGNTLAEQAGQWYAGILSAVHSRDYAQARQWLPSLRVSVAHDARASRLADLLELEAAIAAADPAWIATALAAVDAQARKRPELLLRAQALATATHQNAEPVLARSHIIEPLQTWVLDHPQDAAAWQALAQLWAASGHALRAVRAEAEAHVARLDYSAAIDRFKAGLALARQQDAQASQGQGADAVETAILTSRLQAVQGLQREREKTDKERGRESP
ncbi:Putative Zn-dependent protease, contains TPR repeats [Lampropedia hyalina DSM 16112]|uniref:Putative Zn-dependent protease, contains TPR repeats n=1 Tax=Lampropedia hyalina DSM 16112 TaxID=1122156 RepID=A0A1M4VCJ9_9BURK|nr:M48 family metalloprotease [Lampropedia hyalina]SHE66653.1 Putative Zn-dependent protease, contains TPR repeats [Lampropedia hyalina DSM 16112]